MQTGVQSETKCSFVATKFRYATLWTPILAVLRKSYKFFMMVYVGKFLFVHFQTQLPALPAPSKVQIYQPQNYHA